MGDGERYEARTAVFAGEGELNVFRFQKILMAAEVMREDMRGDAGDADFEEEVGGGTGPSGSVFQERCDGVQDRRSWGFVKSANDGNCAIRESGRCPMGGIGVSRRRVEARGGVVGKSGAGGVAEGGEDLGAYGFEFGPEIGFGAAGGGGERRKADGDSTSG